MNNLLPLHSAPALRRSAANLACVALLFGCLLATSLPGAPVQSDNFNDGNDTGWIRYDPIAAAAGPQATWSFPSGGYRIQTAVSPAPGQVGPGRAGSLRPESYTDFYLAVDILNWDDSLDQSIGILARITDIGLGATDGYAMTYQVRGHDISITRFTDEDTSGGDVRLTGVNDVMLVPGHSYRLVFIGKGSQLIARVYELPDTLNPILDASGTDSTYPGGQGGLIVFDNTSTGSGLTDATFDNFYATDIEPPRITMTGDPFGTYRLSWPLEASAFVLQSASSLTGSAADWSDVTSGVRTDADSIFYLMDTDPILGVPPKLFFRLRRP